MLLLSLFARKRGSREKRGWEKKRRKVFFSSSLLEEKRYSTFCTSGTTQRRKWPFGVWSRLGHAEILSSPSIAFPPEKLFYVVENTTKGQNLLFFRRMKIHDKKESRRKRVHCFQKEHTLRQTLIWG